MPHNPAPIPPVKSSDQKEVPQRYSGRELLDILSGWRAGDMNAFTL
jgi:hypothetical protein